MRKWLFRIAAVFLLGIFLIAVVSIVGILYQYHVSERLYDDIAAQYAHNAGGSGDGKDNGGKEDGADAFGMEGDRGMENLADAPPITVDFAGLTDLNSDIVGWIYCEGTAINYPVLQCGDNDYYLRRSYDGAYNAAGSIFVEELNRPVFEDSNTIIYGHHMKNGSTMFADLDKWSDQDFYEEHSFIWLLTPQQDYKIVLFSGYTTSAYSETYTIFTGPGAELDEYLEKCVAASDFQADEEIVQTAEEIIQAQTGEKPRYVLLSTCSYAFDNARYVLHGLLVPVGSTGSRH